MGCAAVDDTLMIQRQNRAKQMFRRKMCKFFEESDTSGDGMINKEEFKSILTDERVNTWLQPMEISIHDPDLFFRRIAGQDMLLSSDELVKNMAGSKGVASQIDAITLIDDCAELKQSIAGLVALVAQQSSQLQSFASDLSSWHHSAGDSSVLLSCLEQGTRTSEEH